VWLAADYLAELVLADLYRFSSAYLCRSIAAEPAIAGINGLWRGADHARHTPMLDYICEDNSIIVARNSIRSSGPTHPWGPSGMAAGTSAGAAMSRAHCGSLPGLGEADRRDLGARPHAAIVGDFSVAAVARLVRSRLCYRQ